MVIKKSPSKKSGWLLFLALFLLFAGIIYRVYGEFLSSKLFKRNSFNVILNGQGLHISEKKGESFTFPLNDTNKYLIYYGVEKNYVDRAIIYFWKKKIGDENFLKADLEDIKKGKFSLAEENIVSENLRLEVLNVGSESGVANTASEVIALVGGDVVNVANSTRKIDGDCLITTSLLESVTVKRLSQMFGCEIEKKDEGDRAQITLFLQRLRLDE